MLKVSLYFFGLVVAIVGLYLWNFFYSFVHVQNMQLKVLGDPANNQIELICINDSEASLIYELSLESFNSVKEFEGQVVEVKIAVSGHPKLQIYGSSISKINNVFLHVFRPLKTSKILLLGQICPSTL